MEFFKVKKVKYLGENRIKVSDSCERVESVEKEDIAVIIPAYKINSFWTHNTVESLDDSISIFTLTGDKITIKTKNIINISSTRITNKAIKESLELIIKEEKKKYALAFDIIKKQEYINSCIKDISEQTSLISDHTNELLKLQDILPKRDFKDLVFAKIKKSNFDIKIDFNDSKLTSIVISREVMLGKYLNETNCNFSFVDFEYDGYIYVVNDEELDKCEDFKKLVALNFKEVKEEKINNIPLTTKIYPCNGDKNSLYLIQSILLNVNYVCNTKNINQVSNLINKAIDLVNK